jgi:hypothetical protein
LLVSRKLFNVTEPSEIVSTRDPATRGPLENDFEEFENLFFHEVESWFSADIACCDQCYDDFVSRWPALFLRDQRFQEATQDLSLIYSGSLLRERFSADEFQKYIRQVLCPRCNRGLSQAIWPYNFRHQPPERFEQHAAEIAMLASRSPFVVLSHPLAQKVFEEIEMISFSAEPTQISSKYYRGRSGLTDDIIEIEQFDRPPTERCPINRYNHRGRPALYLASDVETCVNEVSRSGETVHIAECEIDASLNILELIGAGGNASRDWKRRSQRPRLLLANQLSEYDSIRGWLHLQQVCRRLRQRGWP